MKTMAGSSSSGKSAKKETAKKTSGKKSTRSSGSAKKGSARSGAANESQLRRSNQLFAVILFSLGILLTLFALFNGPMLWGAVHQMMRGIFGPISYVVGPICIGVSLMIALEKSHAEVHLRVWELVVLMVLLCGLSQFFYGYPAGDSFFERILQLYLNGTRLRSGGLMAGLTAWPLMKVLGNTGSLIVHILLLFILVMAVTGATLLELIDSVRGPVQRLKESYEDNQEVRRARREAREQMMESQMAERADERAARLEERKRQAIIAEQAGKRYESRFNIDVAMSDEEAQQAAQQERRRADKKAAAAQEKKESSAHGLEQALNRIRSESGEQPTGMSAENETKDNKNTGSETAVQNDTAAAAHVVDEDTTGKQGADEPSLDAIIAAFKKKPAAGEDKPVQPVLKEETIEEPVFTETSVSSGAAPAVSLSAEQPPLKMSSANPAGVGETIAELLESQPEPPQPDIPDDLPFDLDQGDVMSQRMGSALHDIRSAQSDMPAVQPEEPATVENVEPEAQTEAAVAPVAAAAPVAPPVQQEYRLPPVSLLKLPKNTNNADVSEELKMNASKLVETLKSFGVQTRIVDITRGPTVTRYELQPSTGVKISKITGLADDIALNLATAGVRIEAPIPNKPAVGIEVPNRVTDTVTIREVIDSEEFRNARGALPAAFGRDIAGQITIGDIAAMPHMLIAGTTGSGKSVCVNSIIISLLYRFAPKDLRLIMVDPKMVEMVIYNGIPHLLVPVVTDARKASGALGWAVNEMLKRYATFSEHAVRDIKGYNRLVERAAEGEQQTAQPLEHMPYIVVVIDELSDLMMAAPNEVEDAICRIAQMGRAAGINLIVATQRPSVDVVTGLIKANIPSRIALTVSSQIDSRTIIDTSGAEKLLGHGDMLYAPVGKKPTRVQGCYVSDEEVEDVVRFIKENQATEVQYDARIMEEIEQRAAAEPGSKKGKGGGEPSSDGDSDPLIMEAVDVILDAGQASTSYLQRRLKVGYARAARLMDELEDRGIVGPQDGSKPRELLITRSQWQEIKERMENP